jgi:hypothetical protein
LGARSAGIRAVWLDRNGRGAPEVGAVIESLLPTDRVVAMLLQG